MGPAYVGKHTRRVQLSRGQLSCIPFSGQSRRVRGNRPPALLFLRNRRERLLSLSLSISQFSSLSSFSLLVPLFNLLRWNDVPRTSENFLTQIATFLQISQFYVYLCSLVYFNVICLNYNVVYLVYLNVV